MPFNKVLKLCIISFSCLILSSCLSFSGLSHKQIRILKSEGFVLTDEGWSLGLPESLLFAFNASEIKTTNEKQLIALANQLHKYHLDKVKIVGHTDNIGNAEYNLKLSSLRAQSVAAIFLKHGFNSNHIITIGKGSSQPIKANDTDEHRAMNRRVSVIVIP